MTRRILFMLLAFTAIVLVGAVVPLTLNATSHDRNSFIQATEGMDEADAALVQARLDNDRDPALLGLIAQVEQSGDGLLVLGNNCDLPVVSGQPYPCNPVNDTNMPGGSWSHWIPLAKAADEQAHQASRTVQLVQPIPRTDG